MNNQSFLLTSNGIEYNNEKVEKTNLSISGFSETIMKFIEEISKTISEIMTSEDNFNQFKIIHFAHKPTKNQFNIYFIGIEKPVSIDFLQYINQSIKNLGFKNIIKFELYIKPSYEYEQKKYLTINIKFYEKSCFIGINNKFSIVNKKTTNINKILKKRPYLGPGSTRNLPKFNSQDIKTCQFKNLTGFSENTEDYNTIRKILKIFNANNYDENKSKLSLLYKTEKPVCESRKSSTKSIYHIHFLNFDKSISFTKLIEIQFSIKNKNDLKKLFKSIYLCPYIELYSQNFISNTTTNSFSIELKTYDKMLKNASNCLDLNENELENPSKKIKLET